MDSPVSGLIGSIEWISGSWGLRRRKEVTLSDLGDVLRSDRPLAGFAYFFSL